MSGFICKLKTTLNMIKFEHTLFALPFALLGAVLAEGGIPAGEKIGWVWEWQEESGFTKLPNSDERTSSARR